MLQLECTTPCTYNLHFLERIRIKYRADLCSLCAQARGSALAARFRGSWEQCLDRDDQGRIFLDFDPQLFQHILSYLRFCATQSDPDTRPCLPTIEPNQQAAYMNLVNYLVLGDFMGYTGSIAFLFSSANPEFKVTPQQNRATAISGGNKYRGIPLEPAIQGVGVVKFKISKNQQWMFVGVAADIADSTTFYNSPSSYGWGHSNQYYCKGQNMVSSPYSQVSLRTGEVVLVKADFPGQKLLFKNLSASTVAQIPLDEPAEKQNKFVFHVIMYYANDEVELLPVTAEDLSGF